MKLLKATIQDTPVIMQLIRSAIIEMQNNDIDQWGDFYPTEEIIRKDIEEQRLYLLKVQSRIIGIVVINEYQDAKWLQVQWLTQNGKPLIVHRLTIDPAFQGQGYGRRIMEWVENHAKSEGYSSIRLDAYQGNPAALALYENHEFTKTGEVFFPNHSLSFNCYEKVFATL